ncbi:acyltransferase [Parabacteroides sp. FAFU027]|uniref:acyltransferase n=1 Tax=Parabacteroides sp. FAFU027 TaxID=2922715 RepID=UPI001FAE8CEB|nr:acyltransferase family protein [Parabacteroides sp. FAFU027]
MQTRPKLIWADNLRAIATIAVITLHASSGLLLQFGKVPDSYWEIGCFYNGLGRFAVPVFVMLSGALLLDRELPVKDFLKKRFSRILYPFLFWSLIYIAVSLYYKSLHGHHLNWSNVPAWIGKLLINGSSYHFWYIYMILGLYLFIPVLGKWIRNCPRKEMYYFLAIWFVVQFLNTPYLIEYKPKLRLDYFADYPGYLVLGYLLSKASFHRIKHKSFVFLSLSIALLAFAVCMAIYDKYHPGHRAGDWFSPTAPNVILLASSVFLFFKSLHIRNTIIVSVLAFISRYSYGIFLVHVLVLSRMANWFQIHWNFTHPVIAIPVTAIVCLILSATLIFLLRKIPGLKTLAG